MDSVIPALVVVRKYSFCCFCFCWISSIFKEISSGKILQHSENNRNLLIYLKVKYFKFGDWKKWKTHAILAAFARACVCVYGWVGGWVCVCVYTLPPWRLLPTARRLWHTWGVRIKNVICEYYVIFHLRRRNSSLPTYWRENMIWYNSGKRKNDILWYRI